MTGKKSADRHSQSGKIECMLKALTLKTGGVNAGYFCGLGQAHRSDLFVLLGIICLGGIVRLWLFRLLGYVLRSFANR